MERSLSGRSWARSWSSLAGPRPDSLFLLLFVFAALAVWSGCERPPSADRSAEDLRKENEQLKAQLKSAEDGRVQAVTLLNEITRSLSEMTGRETEIRARQSELDPATWETSTDLRERITADLGTLQTQMQEIQKKYEEAVQAAAPAPASAEPDQLTQGLQATIANLKSIVDEKERTISSLQAHMKSLEEEAAILRKEVEEGRKEVAELLENQQKNEEERRQQRELIEDLTEIGTGYVFVGNRDAVESALQRQEIVRYGRTYHASPDVVMAPSPPRIFRKVDPQESEIPLGYHLRDVDVISVHRRFQQAFYVSRNGDETVLRLEDPAAFWKINKFLIVRVKE